MQDNVYTNPLNLELWCNWLASYFYSRSEKCFKFFIKCRKKKWKFEDGTGPKTCLLRQSLPKYLEQNRDIQ